MDTLIDFLANGLTHASGWEMLAYTLIATHITIAAVTIFLHRAQAHRALDLHPAVAHFFRFWLWFTTGMVTKEWVSIHRKHHARCERDGDPHSPMVFGIRKVFFEGVELYRAEARNKETMEKFGHGTPDDWIERNVYSRFTWHGCGVLLITNWLLFGAIGTTIWAVQMLWIPILAAGVVNGIGHYWGYRNFASPDASRNVLPWGILIGGEELHNNHHTYASSAKLSNKWYEFDIGWMYIRILEMLGLAHVRKVAPRTQLNAAARPVVDAETLQALITYRYEIMARYAKVLRRASRAEVARLRAEAPAGSQWQLLARARRWLYRDGETPISPAEQQVLEQALSHSAQLQLMVQMRRELAALWERSHASTEQLIAQLQDWCQRAQQSGIASMQDLALRIRMYATPAAAA